jgi:diadenosine tetraphosphate (Ap4A) HIT family hydrolase
MITSDEAPPGCADRASAQYCECSLFRADRPATYYKKADERYARNEAESEKPSTPNGTRPERGETAAACGTKGHYIPSLARAPRLSKGFSSGPPLIHEPPSPMTTPSSTSLIHERVALARQGKNPTVIGRLQSGWAVLGDSQFPLGYCVLLADPVVASINDLRGPERAQFLSDMVAIGDALLLVTSAYRINYEIQGNTDRALHAHIFARYVDEDPLYVSGPVWRYERSLREAARFDPAQHAGLASLLRGALAASGTLGAPASP